MTTLNSLGDICKFRYGKSLPEASRLGGTVPVFGSNGRVGFHNQSLTSGPTIVIGRKGSFGEVNYSADACWPIDTTYFVDQASTSADLRWLYHLLRTLGLNRLNRAAAVPGLNREDAYRKQVGVPPLDEQRRIAAMLDKAEELRAKRRAALALLDQLPQAIFLEMFGDPKNNEMSWPRRRMGDLARIRTGGTPSRTIEANYGGPIPWVKTGEVNGQPIRSTEESLTEAGLKNSNCHLFPVGSVVIAMYGQGKTRGRCSILEIEATTNQACAVVLPSDKLSTSFLFAQLSLSYEQLRSLARGGNQPNLNLGLVSGFEVIFPPIGEQHRFAARVEAIHHAKAAHQTALGELNALFSSLQHVVFASGSSLFSSPEGPILEGLRQ